MLQVLNQFPNILKAPQANIFVDKFDDSSINLNLRFWINSSDEFFLIKSNVTETINLAFKQA
jgi:small-conductance mechanosensitive channel